MISTSFMQKVVHCIGICDIVIKLQCKQPSTFCLEKFKQSRKRNYNAISYQQQTSASVNTYISECVWIYSKIKHYFLVHIYIACNIQTSTRHILMMPLQCCVGLTYTLYRTLVIRIIWKYGVIKVDSAWILI